MGDEDAILAFLDDGDKELIEGVVNRLEAVVSATSYTLALPAADAEVVTEKGKWEHLEGVLYRRRCSDVSHEKAEGILMFEIGMGNANVDDVVQAISEELDEITGRKMEAAGAEAWGMF